jgi:hypothetical protein
MTTGQQTHTDTVDAWADLSGRWFFAWRMAAACETALREVHSAMGQRRSADRMQALEKASLLLRKELVRWVRRGEALDMIVERLPKQPA